MTGSALCDKVTCVKRRRWSVAAAITPIAIAFVATASLGQAPSVQVPNVVGQKFDQAVCILQLRGLRIEKPPYAQPSYRVVNEPLIAWQDPPWKTQVPPGTLVHVIVRPSERPPSLFTVPAIGPGTRVATAKPLLEKFDMCVQVEPPQALKFPQAVVVKEMLADNSPVPREIPRGTRIVLYAGIQVPPVVGRSLTSAETTLQQAGLAVGRIARSGPAIPSESVTDQRPASGAMVALGTAVSLTVTGPPTAPPPPPPPPRFMVPYLIGEPLDQALQDLETHGFTSGPVTRQVSNGDPGTVVDQTPSAGVLFPRPLPIVSLRVAAIQVPDVVGRPMRDAVAALSGAGLSVGTVTRAESAGLSGVIVSQSVSAGSLVVPPLPSVDLTESAVAVPSVIGRTLDDARRVLGAVGLKMGAVSRTPTQAPPGTVTGQSLSAGTLVVPPLPGINVTASALPMPAVVGQSLDDATRVLADTGLKVGSSVAAASAKPIGTVIEQDPSAGTLLSPPLPFVGLTIAAVQVPSVAGQSPAAAKDTLARARLGAGVPPWSGLPFVTVASQNPSAGVLITETGTVVALTLDFSTLRNLSALAALALVVGAVTAWNVNKGRRLPESQVEVRSRHGQDDETALSLDGIPVQNGASLIADPGVQLQLVPDRGAQSMTPADVLDHEEDGPDV